MDFFLRSLPTHISGGKKPIFIVPVLVTIRTEQDGKKCVGGDRIPAIIYTHSKYNVRLHTEYIRLQEK